MKRTILVQPTKKPGIRVLHLAIAFMLAETLGAAAQKAAFEVTAVKRNTVLGVETTLRIDPGGHLRVVGAPLFWLIAGAYGDATGGLRSEQVVGAPGWLRSERYDINATVADTDALGKNVTFITMRPYLQSLLENRFQLRVHHERRDLPIYALVRLSNKAPLGRGMSHSSVDCAKEAARCGFKGGPVGRNL